MPAKSCAGQGPRNLTASDRVDIRSDGSLTGDVVAARISIEDGAFFKGGIDIRKAGQQPGQKPNGEEKTSLTKKQQARTPAVPGLIHVFKATSDSPRMTVSPGLSEVSLTLCPFGIINERTVARLLIPESQRVLP